jgi:hypothetical protein
MAASYLGGYLAIFAPAGAGVREGVMGLLLTQVAPPPAAIVIAVASRIWFTATELIVLLVIPFLRRPPEELAAEESGRGLDEAAEEGRIGPDDPELSTTTTTEDAQPEAL